MRLYTLTSILIVIFSSAVLSDIRLIGANSNASPEGNIPKWNGGLAWQRMDPLTHHTNPFAHDKPFIINAKNYSQYSQYLSPGLVALLVNYPDTFYIPVYPTRRSSSYPDWYYQNMKEITNKPTLTPSGNGIINPIAGTNFPHPSNGLEALWNHITRWRGHFMQRKSTDAVVYPNGKKKLTRLSHEVGHEVYRRDKTSRSSAHILLYYTSRILSPAKLAGNAFLSIDFIDKQDNIRQSWSYDSGQRRVKRLPFVAYDHPAMMSENIRTADDTDMFNGSPERYDWKLIGKKVMYIPYNSYNLSSPDIIYDELLTPFHLEPKHTRFEAHRVWVIEATLKSGEYHIYPRRVFYLDEDSWSIALADQYDQKGNLWRVSMAHLKNHYEMPLVVTGVDVYHDLKTKLYHASGLSNEEKHNGVFSNKMPPPAYFTPSALRSHMK